MTQPLQHPKPPKLANERTGLNDKVANFIATTVGSMWMFYASIIGFAVWMAGLGVTVAGDNYPYNLMLLAVGGIMQWLAMIAILVAQERSGERSRQAGRAPTPARRNDPQTGRGEHRADRSDPRPRHEEERFLAGLLAVSRPGADRLPKSPRTTSTAN
jgi:hypothetical protein